MQSQRSQHNVASALAPVHGMCVCVYTENFKWRKGKRASQPETW